MLSLGTELDLAFWMASASVGLPAGSPPPVRAATSTFLMSLANSLPRRASTTAFLCFVVAHLEWPLTRPPPARHPRTAPASPAQLFLTIDTNNSCTRGSAVSSGWNAVAISGPCRTATILPALLPSATVASVSTSGPHLSTHGARMRTAVIGRPGSGNHSTTRSDESTCRPNALRRTVTSRPPTPTCSAVPSSTRSASRIIPAQEPNAGMPSPTRFCSGSSSSKVTSSLPIVVDSPPGMTTASTCSSSSGRRTRTASTSQDVSAARCSRTSPCNASTPIVGALTSPTAFGETVADRERVDRDADHRLAEPARDLGDHVRIVVHRRRLDDGASALRRVAGLEDAATDEHAVGTELHHHRRVRGRRDAAGGEQHDRERSRLRDLAHQLVRRLNVLGGDVELVLAHRRQPAQLSADRAHVGDRVGHVTGAGLPLRPNHRGTLVDPSQCLTQVGGTADERDGEPPLVDVVRVVGRRQYLGLVDVVDPECLQHLRLDEVADPRLGHHRDRDRGDDALDHVRVAHPGDAALGADVGRHPFERHHRDRTAVLGDLRLLGRDDVHDDAALEHLGHAALHPGGAGCARLADGRGCTLVVPLCTHPSIVRRRDRGDL